MWKWKEEKYFVVKMPVYNKGVKKHRNVVARGLKGGGKSTDNGE